MIAALYIDERGPYMDRPGVDPWGISRDAKLYDGPYPVVAHPPCGPWSKLRHMCTKQDASCGPRAIEQVRILGGVVEHPAFSGLWTALGLVRPGELPDAYGGRTIEVSQCDFGHVARKRTWLYVVRGTVPPLTSRGTPTHWIAGGRGRSRSRMGASIPEGIKACSSQQARRTPPSFADFLIAIAESVPRDF